MTDQEAFAKITIAILFVVGVVALGYLVIFVLVPLFVLAAVIDFFIRQSYNRKLEEARRASDLVTRPKIHDFDARFHEGRVVIAWLVDLPGDAVMDIYRVEGSGSGSIADIEARGTCIHTTKLEFTDNMEQMLVDVGLPEGTYYYVPVLSGLVVEKEPLPYSFLDFATQVQFSQRRNRCCFRGDAVAVTVADDKPQALPDLRDEAHRLADNILEEFRGRKKRDADLDAAISRIRVSSDLTETEKQAAIELLETRAETI